MNKKENKILVIGIIIAGLALIFTSAGSYYIGKSFNQPTLGAPTKIDISTQTNLAADTPLLLTNDTLSINLASSALEIDSTASISGVITFGNLISCDTIDSNATGLLSCGSDATGGGSGMTLHGLLSDEWHNDVSNASASAGALIYGAGTTWTPLAVGASNSFLLSDGTNPIYLVDPTVASMSITNLWTSTLTGTLTGALTGNASTATKLAANGANCNAGEYNLGVDDSGAAESCTDATTEINAVVNGAGGTNLTCSAQSCNVDDVFFINTGDTMVRASVSDSLTITDILHTGSIKVDGAIDFPANSIAEADISFSTACAAGNHYYLSGDDLACEADDNTTYTATNPLSLVGTAFAIDYASASGGGYLTYTNWEDFNGKLSSLSIDTFAELDAIVADAALIHNDLIDASSELLAIFDDETGTGNIVFSNNPLFTGVSISDDLNVEGPASISDLTLDGTPTFQDFKTCNLDTDANGNLVCGTDATAAGEISPHNFLSDTHNDSTEASVSAGSMIVGDADSWDEFAIGASGSFLLSDGTTVKWNDLAGALAVGGAITEGGIAVLSNDEMDASTELLSIFDDETGTGVIVFGTSPQFTTSFTTAGVFAINPAGALTIGDGGDTLYLNSSDWDIGTTGDMTGIGALTMDGLFSGTGASLSGDLDISGDLNVASATFGGTSVNGGLITSGTITANSFLNVASSATAFGGNVDFYSTASISGAFDFNSTGTAINIGNAGTDFTSTGGLTLANGLSGTWASMSADSDIGDLNATSASFTGDIQVLDILVTGGNINTGNIALVIGDATTDTIQFLTDGTGNGEYTFSADGIGDADIDWGSGAGQVDLADFTGGISGAVVWDFGGATSFEFPNGTSITLDANGEAGIDTTSGQFQYYSGEVNVLMASTSQGFGIKISSTAFDLTTGGDTFVGEPGTIIGYGCSVTGGTNRGVEIIICDGTTCGDGGSVGASITAVATGITFQDAVTSGTFAAWDEIKASTSDGDMTGTVNWIKCRVFIKPSVQ